MAGPILAKTIDDQKRLAIPEEIYEAVNHLIAQNWDGHSAVVQQCAIIEQYLKNVAPGDTRETRQKLVDEAYANHWLDFESAYDKAGWKVVYDKPGYNESYEATFTFTKKPTRRG